MLNRLKKHWKVNNKKLFLIFCTFAITGILTAWLSKEVTDWLFLEKYGLAWWSSKILVLFFGYQFIILMVGFTFGMFSFFWKYEKKILKRFGLIKQQTPKKNKRPIKIAIFASGTGSNAQRIINHFKESTKVTIALIVCNNPKAGVLNIALNENIPVLIIEKNKFLETGYVEEIKNYGIGLIILAGFLWKLPTHLVHAFQNKIINIHPALLPAFGGKGMYGSAVHSAVIAAKEKESGISIHYVDEKYDHGKIIFQAKCSVDENETPESLALKIHVLEHEYYPQIIEKVLSEINS
jgi:formyltetrahydrofolate-dependent phosphoribosylglycinamide formyltransferase